MKKLFLIMMLLLLPLQTTWAAVANYDVQNHHDSSIHFGHHEHQSTDYDDVNIDSAKNNVPETNTPDVDKANIKNHFHYGFTHLSCDLDSSHCLPVFAPADNQYTNNDLLNYHSPASSTLDRPNWLTRA